VNGVVVWSARYSYCHSLDGATLFSKVDLNKLCRSVHNEATLICAKFGADPIIISEDTDHKTKWPKWQIFGLPGIGLRPHQNQNT